MLAVGARLTGGGGYRHGEEGEAEEGKVGSEKSCSESEVEREEKGSQAESGAQASFAPETCTPGADRVRQPERGDGSDEASSAYCGGRSGRRGFWRGFRGRERGFGKRGRIVGRRTDVRGGNCERRGKCARSGPRRSAHARSAARRRAGRVRRQRPAIEFSLAIRSPRRGTFASRGECEECQIRTCSGLLSRHTHLY